MTRTIDAACDAWNDEAIRGVLDDRQMVQRLAPDGRRNHGSSDVVMTAFVLAARAAQQTPRGAPGTLAAGRIFHGFDLIAASQTTRFPAAATSVAAPYEARVAATNAPQMLHKYTDDAPIQRHEDDRFGRWPFAERVARVIATRTERSSIAVGIHGDESRTTFHRVTPATRHASAIRTRA